MTDIVERLRLSVTKGHEPTDEDAIEAADEIERLRAQNAKLLALLRCIDQQDMSVTGVEIRTAITNAQKP
jgi:hypothetical protein